MDETSKNESQARILYRDPNDVLVIQNLCIALIGVILICFSSLGGNLYLYWRKPDRIVVDRSSGQVVTLDNRNYGDGPSTSMMPDRLTPSDALFAVRQWTQHYYAINPATRSADIEKCIRLMVPATAKQFVARLGQDRRLEIERNESHQGVWTIQSETIDPKDNYLLRVIGTQKMTKVINGKSEEVVRQLEVSFKLVADANGRTDENLRSGFRIARVEDKEIGGGQ